MALKASPGEKDIWDAWRTSVTPCTNIKLETVAHWLGKTTKKNLICLLLMWETEVCHLANPFQKGTRKINPTDSGSILTGMSRYPFWRRQNWLCRSLLVINRAHCSFQKSPSSPTVRSKHGLDTSAASAAEHRRAGQFWFPSGHVQLPASIEIMPPRSHGRMRQRHGVKFKYNRH